MLLTINDLSKQLKVKESWIRYKVFKNEIPFLKIGRLIRFNSDSINQWLESQINNVTTK